MSLQNGKLSAWRTVEGRASSDVSPHGVAEISN
jgi:hypothetical protein